MSFRNTSLRFRHAGDCGVTIELGDKIDAATNAAVMALSDALGARKLDGVLEIIPTYRSVLVQFDPLRLSKAALAAAVNDAYSCLDVTQHAASIWHVPVCYGGDHGADLAFVARVHELDEAEVINLHSAALYRIFMIGFAPGFVYLGGLDATIHTSRRTEPRLKTPPRSISIGGGQAAVSPPLEIPSGWHMLGQTPVKTYDPARQGMPFLFQPGDAVRFHPVSQGDYRSLCKAADDGDIIATRDDYNG
jgi:5-oxoprolinase (ATP-hydrolysing) subunit B